MITISDKHNENKDNEMSYLSIGLALGTGLGIVFKNIALGLSLGLAIGAGIDIISSKKDQD